METEMIFRANIYYAIISKAIGTEKATGLHV